MFHPDWMVASCADHESGLDKTCMSELFICEGFLKYDTGQEKKFVKRVMIPGKFDVLCRRCFYHSESMSDGWVSEGICIGMPPNDESMGQSYTKMFEIEFNSSMFIPPYDRYL